MEDTSVIAGLLEKRAQIETAIAELERQIRVRRLEIAQLDATICMFAPSVIAAKREATKFKRSVHFLTGELTRLCLDCLRQADGRLVTAREMAVTALHQKGLDAGDAELLTDFTKRIAWTLNRMLGRGAVTKQGYGASARWGLPT
jgi:hypothetical protein